MWLKTNAKYLILFVLTVITTTLAGAEWMKGNFFLFVEKPLGWNDFLDGFHYSFPFLLALTCHEFGHYFMAKYYQIKVTLPMYLPIWLSGLMSIGTMGAFIRIKDKPKTRQQYFDIGIAGPLAGFVIAIIVLWYGFTHLPGVEYLYSIHPEYKAMGADYPAKAYQNLEGQVYIGENILMHFFKTYIADSQLLPHPFEFMHYPYLFAGYLAIFFTALNLLPIGQLDGGHILYGLVGPKWFNRISPVFFVAFTFYGGLGIFKISDFQFVRWSDYIQQMMYLVFYAFFLKICYSRLAPGSYFDWILSLATIVLQLMVSQVFPTALGYSGFLTFSLLLGRFLGVYHPEVEDNTPLNGWRKLLGWLTLIIFVLCFSPKPFVVY